MRCTPLGYTPVRYTPMRCMLVKYTSRKYTPVRYTPIRYLSMKCPLMRYAREASARGVHTREMYCTRAKVWRLGAPQRDFYAFSFITLLLVTNHHASTHTVGYN
jgi:hypothetical protein